MRKGSTKSRLFIPYARGASIYFAYVKMAGNRTLVKGSKMSLRAGLHYVTRQHHRLLLQLQFIGLKSTHEQQGSFTNYQWATLGRIAARETAKRPTMLWITACNDLAQLNFVVGDVRPMTNTGALGCG
jgi:hypothetical protein